MFMQKTSATTRNNERTNVSNRKQYNVVGTKCQAAGYTLYKITIKELVSSDNLEWIKESFIWKRYTDFKNLHRCLFSIHKDLYLSGKFPTLTKLNFFEKHDQDIIKTQVHQIQELLDFTNLHKALYSCKAIEDFFKDSTPLETSSELSELKEVPIQPMSQKMKEDEKVKKMTDKETYAFMSKADMLFFDPCLSKDTSDILARNEWVEVVKSSIQPSETVYAPECDGQTNTLGNFQHPSQNQSASFPELQDVVSDPVSDKNMSSSTAIELGMDILHEEEENIGMAKDQHRKSSKARAYLNQMLERERISSESGSAFICSDSQIPSTKSEHQFETTVNTNNEMHGLQRLNAEEIKTSSCSVKGSIVGEKDEQRGFYLIEAAKFISSAQNALVDQEHENAFASYKSAINILLQGVQGDTDEVRVQTVRKKTAKYLKKAEEIYDKHLKNMVNSSRSMKTDQNVCHSAFDEAEVSYKDNCDSLNHSKKLEDDCKPAPSPRHASEDLVKFKVLGIVDKVLLVVNTSSQDTFVIKVLPKSCRKSSRFRKTVIPANVPYMVKLYHFFSTSTSIYLVLEHASGGKLWDHLSAFFTNCRKMCRANPKELNDSKLSNTAVTPNNPAKTDLTDRPLLCKSDDSNTTATISENTQFTIDSLGISSDEDVDLHFEQTPTELLGENYTEETDYEKYVNSTELLSEQDLSTVALTSPLLNRKVGSSHALQAPPVLSSSPSLQHIHMADCSPSLSLNSSVEGDEVTADVLYKPNEGEKDISNRINEYGVSTIDPASIFRGCRIKSQNKSEITQKVDENELVQPCNTFKEIDQSVSSEINSLPIDTKIAPTSVFNIFKQMGSQPAQSYRIPESLICTWAAEIIVAVGTLHSLGILCRNLCPDNILLSASGHIRLTYFGKWKQIDPPSACIHADHFYSAPEMINVLQKRTEACDWWSLGALLFELFTAKTLRREYPCGISSHTIICFPDYISNEAKSLLTGLLQYYPSQRLGSGVRGLDDLMAHPFFSNIEWDSLIEYC
ncbi:unnamed protein product [Clavelina lepadiformis]|uniref:Ribosomal protein S6 kinase delta-1 n=1 Tax=Clavelina lepadiformis TaxID=159417 RepID=A0ABP0GK02_CLALP